MCQPCFYNLESSCLSFFFCLLLLLLQRAVGTVWYCLWFSMSFKWMRLEWHLELMHEKPIQGPALGSYGRHIWPSDRHKTVINLGRRVLHCLYTLEFTIIFSLPRKKTRRLRSDRSPETWITDRLRPQHMEHNMQNSCSLFWSSIIKYSRCKSGFCGCEVEGRSSHDGENNWWKLVKVCGQDLRHGILTFSLYINHSSGPKQWKNSNLPNLFILVMNAGTIKKPKNTTLNLHCYYTEWSVFVRPWEQKLGFSNFYFLPFLSEFFVTCFVILTIFGILF